MIIWNCTVIHRGIDRDALPPGSDLPMRQAVGLAFADLTGQPPEGLSSGWGQKHLPGMAAAVLDGRTPDDAYWECWKRADVVLAELGLEPGEDLTPKNDRYTEARSALTEALYATHLAVTA